MLFRSRRIRPGRESAVLSDLRPRRPQGHPAAAQMVQGSGSRCQPARLRGRCGRRPLRLRRGYAQWRAQGLSQSENHLLAGRGHRPSHARSGPAEGHSHHAQRAGAHDARHDAVRCAPRAPPPSPYARVPDAAAPGAVARNQASGRLGHARGRPGSGRDRARLRRSARRDPAIIFLVSEPVAQLRDLSLHLELVEPLGLPVAATLNRTPVAVRSSNSQLDIDLGFEAFRPGENAVALSLPRSVALALVSLGLVVTGRGHV